MVSSPEVEPLRVESRKFFCNRFTRLPFNIKAKTDRLPSIVPVPLSTHLKRRQQNLICLPLNISALGDESLGRIALLLSFFRKAGTCLANNCILLVQPVDTDFLADSVQTLQSGEQTSRFAAEERVQSVKRSWTPNNNTCLEY